MNLFLRRLWVFLRAHFTGKNGPIDDIYTLNFRVWITDQDMFLHMTNSRYLSFSDLGRLNMLMRNGIWRSLKAQNWQLEVRGQTRTISRMLKSPQTFEMACQVEGWTDDLLAICHRFQRGNKVHAEVKTLMQICDRDGNIIPVTSLLEQLRISAPSPKLTEGFQELLDSLGVAKTQIASAQ